MENAIVEVLRKLGYTNVVGNFGTVLYTDRDGQSWSLCPLAF